MMYLVSDGSHTEDTFKTLADAKYEVLVRYDLFLNGLWDCYYTPEVSEKKLLRQGSFEFYGLDDEGQPDYNRKYSCTITRVESDYQPVAA